MKKHISTTVSLQARQNQKVIKEIYLAGGRLIGTPITLVVNKKHLKVTLTILWNNDAFKKSRKVIYQKRLIALPQISLIVMFIAVATLFIGGWFSHHKCGWCYFRSNVACPVRLALAAPFTFGSMLRVLGITIS